MSRRDATVRAVLLAAVLLGTAACEAAPPTRAEREASFGSLDSVSAGATSLRFHVLERTVGISYTVGQVRRSGESVTMRLETFVGTAAAIAPDGYFLTAAHVVRGVGSDVYLSGDLAGALEEPRARVVWRGDSASLDTDLAILKAAVRRPIPCFEWEEIDWLRAGEGVALAGQGVVSPSTGDGGRETTSLAVFGGRLLGAPAAGPSTDGGGPAVHQIYVSALTSHGDSGGPVVSRRGRLAGITIGEFRATLLRFTPDSRTLALRPDPRWVEERIALDRAHGRGARTAETAAGQSPRIER